MIKLKDICIFKEGYVNPSQGTHEYFDGEIKWIRANDVNYNIVYETSRTLTRKGFLSAGKSAILFKPNTIVVTKSGTIGRTAIIKDYMCGNRAIINIELKSANLIDTKYVYYYLCANRDKLTSIAVGTTQLNLYISNLSEVLINYGDFQFRQHIVNIKGELFL